MRSIHCSLAITLVAAVALAAFSGCGSSADAGCQKACESVSKCAGTSDDPASYCMLACAVSDAEAESSGCTDEYTALNKCFAGLDPATCPDTSPCQAQSMAYGSCYSAWCAKQPSQCPSQG